jgi:hypothetical protein
MSAHGETTAQGEQDAPTLSLAALPAGGSAAQPLACANCGAALVSDQRYCLSCGQPVSPVRLAFLDVLETEQARRSGSAPQGDWVQASGYALAPAGWAPVAPSQGAGGWLRRNSALLSLLSLLVLCLIAGLLVGHWASGGKASNGPQVFKIEGLGALAPTSSSAPTTTTGSATKHASSSSAAKEEAEESAEAAKETQAEKAPPPKPVQVSKSKIQKLTQSTGKKHQEEIESLGAQPIETK